MSRTKKGTKSCGHEYWGRRPLSQHHGATPGRVTKTLTHRVERRIDKKIEREELLNHEVKMITAYSTEVLDGLYKTLEQLIELDPGTASAEGILLRELALAVEKYETTLFPHLTTLRKAQEWNEQTNGTSPLETSTEKSNS